MQTTQFPSYTLYLTSNFHPIIFTEVQTPVQSQSYLDVKFLHIVAPSNLTEAPTTTVDNQSQTPFRSNLTEAPTTTVDNQSQTPFRQEKGLQSQDFCKFHIIPSEATPNRQEPHCHFHTQINPHTHTSEQHTCIHTEATFKIATSDLMQCGQKMSGRGAENDGC